MRRKLQIQREIEITQLDLALQKLKKSDVFNKEGTASDKLKQSLEDYQSHVLGAHLLVKQKRAALAKEFADDPEELRRHDEALQRWLEDQMQK